MSLSSSASAQPGVVVLVFPSWTDNQLKERAVKLVTYTSPNNARELKGPQALVSAADEHWAGTQGQPKTCVSGSARLGLCRSSDLLKTPPLVLAKVWQYPWCFLEHQSCVETLDVAIP